MSDFGDDIVRINNKYHYGCILDILEATLKFAQSMNDENYEKDVLTHIDWFKRFCNYGDFNKI